MKRTILLCFFALLFCASCGAGQKPPALKIGISNIKDQGARVYTFSGSLITPDAFLRINEQDIMSIKGVKKVTQKIKADSKRRKRPVSYSVKVVVIMDFKASRGDRTLGDIQKMIDAQVIRSVCSRLTDDIRSMPEL